MSIVVPSFNRPHFLRAALRSVENQTINDFELIVQDNASVTDISSLAAEFSALPCRVYRNENNIPQTQNIALGISRATGKYVAVLCDDDLWQPNFLSTMITALEQRSDCVLAFANLDLIDATGSVLPSATKNCRTYHGLHLLETGYYQPFEHLATLFRAICVFSGCVFRRGEADLSKLPADLSTTLDTYIGFQLARSGGAAYYSADRLFQVRYHTGTVSSAGNTDPNARLVKHKSHIALWDALLKDPCAHHKNYYYFKRASHFGALAGDFLRQGQWLDGLHQIMKSGGILDPRSAFYFLYFLYYVKSIGLSRQLIP